MQIRFTFAGKYQTKSAELIRSTFSFTLTSESEMKMQNVRYDLLTAEVSSEYIAAKFGQSDLTEYLPHVANLSSKILVSV